MPIRELNWYPGIVELSGFGLREINWYPYLLWAFYGLVVLLSPYWAKTTKRLLTFFLITLIFETAFVIDVGFFIRPSYLIGLIVIVRTAVRGLHFPPAHTILITLFAGVAAGAVFLNLDLIGAATSGESRATFLRPLIQLGQLTAMGLIMVATFTLLTRGYFRHTMRVLHWLSVAVALAAIYEITAIYLHLPYLNLNNMLPAFWYPRFGIEGSPIFRARVTFIEPIELNNFQMFGIACSLAYRMLYAVPWRRYWPLLAIQLLVLLGTFSRSTFLVVLVLAPILILFYPRSSQHALGFLGRHALHASAAALGVALVAFTFTATPQMIERSNAVVQALFTRLILHQAAADKLNILGRGDAMGDIQRLVENDRSLAFGVGIGNDANLLGGIGGAASLYTQIVTYTGLVGLALFLLFAGVTLWGLLRNAWQRRCDRLVKQVCWVFCIGLTGVLAQRMSFSGLLTDTYLWVAFSVAVYLTRRGTEISFAPARQPIEVDAADRLRAVPRV